MNLIGKGGFASVYKVKYRNQVMAMKEIQLDFKQIENV
jgi:hypothetical protein